MLSIVIPVYNEEKNIYPLYALLQSVLEKAAETYEIIFVNDGSVDATHLVLEKLSEENEQVKYIRLSRNFGHQMALTAGLDYSSGDAVISMDGDLQHSPQLLLEMIQKWREGYEVVYTVRQSAEETNWIKRKTSTLFYKFFNFFSSVKIPANTADFRLLDRKIVDLLARFPEKARFLRGLIPWVGFKQYAIEYQVEPRHSGKSKYSLKKMFNFALDGITAFSVAPLHFMAVLGLFVSFFSFAWSLYIVYEKLFTSNTVAGWTSVMVGLLFLGGVQLICFGILGAYIGKIYQEVKGRPLYLIAEKKNFEEGGLKLRNLPRQDFHSFRHRL